jgi:hypothetical protein
VRSRVPHPEPDPSSGRDSLRGELGGDRIRLAVEDRDLGRAPVLDDRRPASAAVARVGEGAAEIEAGSAQRLASEGALSSIT